MQKSLEGLKVAIVATDMFEEDELTKPQAALKAAGATTEIIAPKGPTIIAARHFDKGNTYKIDHLLSDVDPADYDALLLPGGALNADALRAIPEAQSFVQYFDGEGLPIAAICHAPWLLISAGLVKGRTLTSFETISTDIENAGAHWLDEPVVRNENWVSSRKPDDIPLFNDAMISLFAPAGSDQETVEARELAFREKLDTENDA